MKRVLLVALLLLPASARAQDNPAPHTRIGIGLDYAGIAGRGDGGLAGLRLTLGARVDQYLAVYWQAQLLGGAFVEPGRGLAMGVAWNAVLAELNVDILQIGVGPSFDAQYQCGIETGGQSSTSGCGGAIAPGLATRAGLRFGMFTISGDMHVSFHETGPAVWVLAGIGMQLGDEARQPMRFQVTRDPDDDPDPFDVDAADDDNSDSAPDAVMAAISAPTSEGPGLGRALGEPWSADDLAWAGEPVEAEADELPSESPDVTSLQTDVERARAPEVRRFSPLDVERRTSPRGARRAPERARVEPRQTAPSPARRPWDPALEFDDTDDPIEGLPSP